MNKEPNLYGKESVPTIVVSYVLSGVTCVIGFFLWFLLRDLVNTLLAVSPLTSWSYRFIEISAFIIFGVCWLIMAFTSQHMYEKEFRRGWTFKKFELYTVWELMLMFFSNLIIYLLVPAKFTSGDLKEVTAEFAVGVLFILLYFRKGKTNKENSGQSKGV